MMTGSLLAFEAYGLIILFAMANAQLVGPGAMTQFNGGGGGGARRGGFTVVRDPAEGFFVAGSSIQDMNGVYKRSNMDALPFSDETRNYRYVYFNKYVSILTCNSVQFLYLFIERLGYWNEGLVDPPDNTEISYELVGNKRNEWVFIDNFRYDRFAHEGATFVPGAGTRWIHVKRGYPYGPNKKSEETSAVDIADTPDEDQLPWQFVYIGDRSMVEQLERKYEMYMANIKQVLDYNRILEDGRMRSIKPKGAIGQFASTAVYGDPPEGVEVDSFDEFLMAFERNLTKCGDHKTDLDKASWKWAILTLYQCRCLRRARKFEDAMSTIENLLINFPTFKDAIAEKVVLLLDTAKAENALASVEHLLYLDRFYDGIDRLLYRASADVKRKQNALTEAYNHYLKLEINWDFEDGELKRAYRRMSKLYHPDKFEGPGRVFEEIATAYNTLSDNIARFNYDVGSDLDEASSSESFKSTVEKRYFPERFGSFEPFGDPLERQRQHKERKHRTNLPKPKPNEPGLPEGTYLKSCSGCSLIDNNTTIWCTHCRGLKSRSYNTTISIASCNEHQIVGNDKGQLMCEEKVDMGPEPLGDYAQSCKYCKIEKPGILECLCHNGRSYLRSKLNLETCGELPYVENIGGKLTCSEPHTEGIDEHSQEHKDEL